MENKKSKDTREIAILSVGGSLIFPDEIDTTWLSNLRTLLAKNKSKYRFIIICGGGKICRKYQTAVKTLNPDVTNDELDWIGIRSTISNAHLVQAMFDKSSKLKVNSKVITNPTEKINFAEDILVAAGWKPGCSTDYDAILIAKNLNVKKVINFTNIDYVYDKDPKKFKDAKPLIEISWTEFRKLLPKEWSPGLNSPFDPIAAKEAQIHNIEVAVINGTKLDQLQNYLEGNSIVGTIIKVD